MKNKTYAPLLAGSTLWCIGIIVAPAVGLHAVYDFFSLICHQQPERSWHLVGEPLPVCIRCASIYFAFTISLWLGTPARASWLRFAFGFMAAEFLFARFFADLASLRMLSGVIAGAAVAPFVKLGMQEAEPPLDFIQPSLAGGFFLGLLSSIPILNIGNCFCCMWILGGGALSVFMLSQQRPSGIRGMTYGDGAFAGVLSGLFGAVVGTAVSIPIRIISARFFASQQQALEKMVEEMPGIEGPMRDLMLRAASPDITLVSVLFTFFMNLIVYALFAMIGGILMVAILQKRKGAGGTPRPMQDMES